MGGYHWKIIPVDIKNGGKWDMVNGPLYAELMEMVISGGGHHHSSPELPNAFQAPTL